VVPNLTASETANPRSLLNLRHFSASGLYLTTAVEDDLKNLIGQVPFFLKIIQNYLEELTLESQAESTGSIDTDQPA
jgi:hypothetical protein